MPVTVLDVAPARSRHSRRVLTDVSTVTVPNPLIRLLDITPGAIFESQNALGVLIAENAYDPARERAFRILGYRERSVKELRDKLSDDGYPDVTVEKVVLRLLELDLLNDERFALHLISTRRASHVGGVRIKRDLLRAGIDTEVAQRLLETGHEPHQELESARRVLRGKRASTAREGQKLVARLIRRGFSIETARKVVAEPPDHSDNDTSM